MAPHTLLTSRNKYRMTPRSMSRTTLTTSSFICSPPTQFPFSFPCANPSHLQYTSFRYFELCRISVCTDLCLDFSLSEKLKGEVYRTSTHYSDPSPLTRPPGSWRVSRLSLGPPRLAVPVPLERPEVPFPGGDNQVP